MELQKLYVTLAMEMKDFAAGLDTAVGQARGFAQRVGGAFAPVAAFARTAFMGIGAAAIGGFAAAGGAAISMNAQLETSTMQFTTLMGSADEAAAHVENLFAFAAATPFESQEIIDASLKLQTFGGEALNTMENLTLVGDAAAAVNAPIDEVAFWVGRLYSNLQAGAPFGEAAARLQELGIMAPTARTELEGMQAAGLSGSEIFAAFQGQLGTFTGAMELQSGTWQGLMSTIKDNLQMAAADGLKPFFDLAKQGLEGLGAWLSSPEVQEGIKNFAEGFRRVIEQVAAFVTDHVVPFVKNHGPELKAALAAIAVIMLASVIPTMITLVTTMAPIVIAVAAVAAAIYLLRKAWEEHGEQIVSTVRKLWEQVKYLFDTAVQNIRDVIAAFKAFFRGDFEEMERLLKDIWERTWAAVIDTVAKLWSLIKPKFAEFLENLKNWFQNDAKEDIKQKVFDILEGLAEWFGKLWEYLGPKFVEMWESLKTWFAEKVQAAIQLGKDIIGGIVQGLQAVGHMIQQTIMNFMQAAWDRITSFWEIESPSQRMYGVGTMIAQGLIDGIDSMAGEAAAAMDALFERMSDVGGLGGGFARFFERQTLDPMRDQLGEFQTALEGMGEQLGLGADAWLDPMTTLRLMRMAGTGFLATTQEEATARTMLAMMRERGELSAEYIDQQARLAELQEKQAQIGFLQQQYELLKLIRDNGLDTSLLEGLTFGLGADAGALMDAMSAAMQAMIQAAEDELGIHSPSRWAIDTMQNLFGTMTRTAEQEAASLRQTLGRALEPALGAVSQETGGGSVDNSRRATNYGGIHYHVQGNGASPLEALWEMA